MVPAVKHYWFWMRCCTAAAAAAAAAVISLDPLAELSWGHPISLEVSPPSIRDRAEWNAWSASFRAEWNAWSASFSRDEGRTAWGRHVPMFSTLQAFPTILCTFPPAKHLPPRFFGSLTQELGGWVSRRDLSREKATTSSPWLSSCLGLTQNQNLTPIVEQLWIDLR